MSPLAPVRPWGVVGTWVLLGKMGWSRARSSGQGGLAWEHSLCALEGGSLEGRTLSGFLPLLIPAQRALPSVVDAGNEYLQH